MSKRRKRPRTVRVRVRIPIPVQGDRLLDFRPELRGPPQNKHGGHQCQRLRVFLGCKLGAANEGRSLSTEERQPVADQYLKKLQDML